MEASPTVEAELAALYATVRFTQQRIPAESCPPRIQELLAELNLELLHYANHLDPTKDIHHRYVLTLARAQEEGYKARRGEFEHPLLATIALYDFCLGPVPLRQWFNR